MVEEAIAEKEVEEKEETEERSSSSSLNTIGEQRRRASQSWRPVGHLEELKT